MHGNQSFLHFTTRASFGLHMQSSTLEAPRVSAVYFVYTIDVCCLLFATPSTSARHRKREWKVHFLLDIFSHTGKMRVLLTILLPLRLIRLSGMHYTCISYPAPLPMWHHSQTVVCSSAYIRQHYASPLQILNYPRKLTPDQYIPGHFRLPLKWRFLSHPLWQFSIR